MFQSIGLGSRRQQERLSQRDNRAVIILRYQVQAAASWGPRIGATAVGFSEIFTLPSVPVPLRTCLHYESLSALVKVTLQWQAGLCSKLSDAVTQSIFFYFEDFEA